MFNNIIIMTDYHHHHQVSASPKLSLPSNGSLVIKQLQPKDEGQYR